MLRKFILLFVMTAGNIIFAQDYYSLIRKKYWVYEENDPKAFIYLNQYILKAKKEKDYDELFQAYKDAILFSKDHKMEYADSLNIAAVKSRDNDLIGDSYMEKGIIFYFNYRKFQPALSEYLKAYSYLKNSSDPFLKYQNLYHIGVVKSYLGYYSEALEIFQECIDYFEPNINAKLHPNLIYNNRKGYFNALHQSIICYQALGNFNAAEKLTRKGLDKLPDSKNFYLEKSYLEKSEGITDFNKHHYNQALEKLNKSLPGLNKINDFTWVSVINFYRGQSLDRLGRKKEAVENYTKVDSIFNKYQFILPELRRNYELLIDHYRAQKDPVNELYYTKQLLKADQTISTDFKYLSSRIHKDYDTKTLLETKDRLESTNFLAKYLLLICFAIIIILAVIVFYRFRKQKDIQKKYAEILLRLNKKTADQEAMPVAFDIPKHSKLDPVIVEKLLKKITNFEQNHLFLEKGITLNKLAAKFKTNTSYLSQIFNEYKGINFNAYLSSLRINYATQKLYNDKQWLKYSIEDIAGESGFNSRQSFSNMFYELNGIRPADFIKKRKEEIDNEKEYPVINSAV